MPLSNPDHLSPTGMRLMPRPQTDSVSPVVPISASQLNADVAAYTAELVELRRIILIKIMGETRGE